MSTSTMTRAELQKLAIEKLSMLSTESKLRLLDYVKELKDEEEKEKLSHAADED